MKRLFSCWLVVLMAVGSPLPVVAQDASGSLTQAKKEELRTLIEDAKSAYNRGEFEVARERFRAAYDIYPHPDILYRIALTHERLGEDQEAVRYYRQFLAEVPDAPERARIEKTIEIIESRIAKSQLAVTTQPDGAVVYIDDEANGAAGYTPTQLQMKPGHYKVIVKKPGFETVEELVRVNPGQTVQLRYQLASERGADAADVDVKKGAGSGPSAGVIALLGVGIASTVAAVVTYFLWADRHEKVSEAEQDPQRYDRQVVDGWRTERVIYLGSFVGSASIATLTLLWAWYAARVQPSSASLAPPDAPRFGFGVGWQDGPSAGVIFRW